MFIFSQLQGAQLENKASNYSAGVIGRIWINTSDSKIYIDENGTTISSFLLNNGKIIIGTNGTANNNVRLHRSANETLQFVKGGDTTAEGSASANLAKLGFKVESFTNAGKPAASVANAGRVIHISDLDVLQRNTEAGAWENLVGAASIAPSDENKSGNFSATYNKVYWISASCDVQLPAPSAGQLDIVLKSLGDYTINILRNGSEKIDNVAATFTFSNPKQAMRLHSNGTDWVLI